jgi:hypothetical protein
LLRTVEEGGEADLEAWEFFIRTAVHSAGGKVLSGLLTRVVSKQYGKPVICECGARMKSRGLKKRRLATILGPIDFHRPLFECPICQKTCFPADDILGLGRTKYSPALERMMTRAGANSPFREGSGDLKLYGGVLVTAKAIERVAEASGEMMHKWANEEARKAVLCFEKESGQIKKTIPRIYISMDGTGVPMIPNQLKGRRGKQPDGSAKTREVKLGCVFTQTTVNEKGLAVRDLHSTSFVGRIEPAEQFGERLFAEAVRRQCHKAREVIVLGDGAAWIKNIVQTHFPAATQIIDLYHAKEHVSDLCKLLYPSKEKKLQEHRLRWWTDLEDGNVKKIIAEATRRLPKNRDRRKKARAEIAYLDNNKNRMRYKDFRQRGLFVGSGVIEAGCKSIIGHRLKQSGMQWSLNGANDIISLRCMMKSSRVENFWDKRVA